MWAIVVPCDETMKSAKLAEILWGKVFSWIGLPVNILGDRDNKLTSSTMI